MDSTMTTFIRKDMLLDAIRRCLNPARLEEEEVVKFKTDIKMLLKQVWTLIAANKFIDTDSWLLYCRFGVTGLHFLSDTNEEFCEYMHYLCSFNTDCMELYIQKLELKLAIESINTFKVSVFYGLISVLLIHKQLYSQKFQFLYDQILIQCQQQTRHNQLYFQLLSQYVRCFGKHLIEEDYDNILDTVYYNLDKKECSVLLMDVLNRSTKTEASHILNATLNNMPWKYKQKYILINEILTKNVSLVTSLPHEECVKGLIFAQSKPYLASAASKLHNTIAKNIEGQLWIETYYSAFEEIIIIPGQPTLCHKNILKYYMTQAFQVSHRFYFENIFEKFLQQENAPIFTILNLTLIGIKFFLFKKDYDFNKIINLGWDDTEDSVRNMSFDVICSVKNVTSVESYEYIRDFILLNINEADQSSRVSIKKSYEKFIKKLENAIIRLPIVDSHVPVVKNSMNFFNWLIPFLLNQFTRSSNYQRVSLSLTLLNVTLSYFSRNKVIDNKGFLHKHKKYVNIVPEFRKIEEYFPQFMNMLEICNIDESQKITQTMLLELNLETLKDSEISAIHEQGLKNICNSNMEVAENGQKFIEFVHQLKFNERKEKLNMLKEMMYQQWEQIKNSESENIVENNALHPFITLITTSINLFDSKEYENLLSFLEDVVSNLLNVFGLRAMLPFNSNYCKGIAKAFENESSNYHACTVNCMWLVLKATCKLAATIAKILKIDIIMHRTLNLIYSIIQKCYHKGALEVAGDTLSAIVSCATAHNYNIAVIDEFLNQIFETIPQSTEATSTVRRAAETRLMLSTIAVNDKRMDKPFFHKTMDFLIRTLDSCLNDTNPDCVAPVHALVLHCLRPIIMDNAVELHIVEYLSAITIISLSSFESHDWKVRNAALQTFGAVTNKLLGTALSSNDDSQHHATCLEEIFFKYPAIYYYILTRLWEAKLAPQKFLNVIIPILSFLSMSYARNDVVIDSTRIKMKELSDILLGFISVAPNLQVFILAAKAYTAICYHKDINREIQRLNNNITHCQDNNSYFSLMYFLKVLSDKIIEDAITLPDYYSEESTILERLNQILATATQRTTFYKVISGVLLYRPGLTTISPENMESNLIYLSSRSEMTSKLPGIWNCMNNTLKLILSFEKMESIISLVKVCLHENISINIKVMCFKTIKDRILHNKEEKKVCEQKLINSLIEFLYKENYMRVRYVMDECINLLINLDMSHVDENLKSKLIGDVNSLKDNRIPYSYMPVFCSICVAVDEDQPNLKEFFEYCAAYCLQNLENENPDPLILKALIYICKFARKFNNNGIMVQNLKIIYKMLQRGDEDFTKECEETFSFCFDMKPKHAYANILELINKENLVKLIGPYFALQFLVQIYCERADEETFGNSVFDQKNTLSIETNVLEDHIFQHTFDTFMINVDNKPEFIVWFTEFKKSILNNKYVQKIIDMYE